MNLESQYQEFKAQEPDKIHLLKVGENYETFGDDAKTLKQLTGEKLTTRNGVLVFVIAAAFFKRMSELVRMSGQILAVHEITEEQ